MNRWKILINDHSHKSQHYINRYINFISEIKRYEKPKDFYTEKHHILPRAVFPEYINPKINFWNIIHLTPKEHYLAHWMLAKIYGGLMWTAFMQLSFNREGKRIGASLYDEGRKKISEVMKIEKKGIRFFNNGTKTIAIKPNQSIPKGFTRGVHRNYKSYIKNKIQMKHILYHKTRYVAKDKIQDYLDQNWYIEGGTKGNKYIGKELWFNNGIVNIRSDIKSKPDGFKRGRLIHLNDSNFKKGIIKTCYNILTYEKMSNIRTEDYHNNDLLSIHKKCIVYKINNKIFAGWEKFYKHLNLIGLGCFRDKEYIIKNKTYIRNKFQKCKNKSPKDFNITYWCFEYKGY